MTDLDLLPNKLASQSISKLEIVLPLAAALEAVAILEAKQIKILGWEGWVKTPEGRVGHGNAPRGTAGLEFYSVNEAADLCRRTMEVDAARWNSDNTETKDKLYFCITVDI